MKFGKMIILGTILASCVPAALAKPINYLYGELDGSGTAQVTATQLVFGNLSGEKPKGATVGEGSDSFSNIGDTTNFLFNFTGIAAKAGPPMVPAVAPTFNFSSLTSGPIELFTVTDDGHGGFLSHSDRPRQHHARLQQSGINPSLQGHVYG